VPSWCFLLKNNYKSMRSKPYSIVSPPFDLLSGGIRVMYGLYGALLAKGQVAFLNAKYEATDFIAVYPEIYYGNPMEAKTVVRYLLNKPGLFGGPTSFSPEEKIFVFSKIYDTLGVDDDHLLFLPILNLHLFRDKKEKRTNRGVYIGKGRDIPLKETEGLPRITRELSSDQNKLADFLNTCEVMYSFENPTAMNEIARLCGCKVCYLTEGATIKYTKEELEEKYEPGMEGVYFGIDEYEGSTEKFDSDSFRERYLGLRKTFEEKIDLFISLTQDSS